MKRKLLVAFMVVFTILLAIILFASLITGAPIGKAELGRYIACAAGISLLLPAGFTFFFLTSLSLSEKVQEREEAAVTEEERKNEDIENTLADIQIPALVNAIAKKQNLSEEEEERILSFIEDL